MPVSRIWELLVRKYNNEISDEELRELELLLQQNQDVLEVNEVLLSLHELPLEQMTKEADERKSADALRTKLALYNAENKQSEEVIALYEEQTRRNKMYQWMGWATGLAAVLLIGLWLWHPAGAATQQANQMNEVVTTGGSKSTIHLPDGSSVILNTGSKLTYNKDFGVGAREIYLKGEAFFKIARNEQLPLTVHAGNVDIKVKGTEFNVKAYTEDSTVEASLITGIIEVFSQTDPERKILLRPNEKILIGKSSTISSSSVNEKPTVSAGEELFTLGKIKPNPSDSSISEIAWIENKLAFYKEPFETLAKKMERWYNVSIHFKDEKLSSLTFTGSFEKEDIVEALDALREITDFDYSIENRNIIISRR